jgi:hypothetical protein
MIMGGFERGGEGGRRSESEFYERVRAREVDGLRTCCFIAMRRETRENRRGARWETGIGPQRIQAMIFK